MQTDREHTIIAVEQLSANVLAGTAEDSCVVKSIEMFVGAGEYVVLMGPSGTGKTTILRAITGCLPSAVSVVGETWRADNLAVAWQKPALMPWRTALANVLVEEEISRSGRLGERAQLLFHHLKLRGAESKYPAELSAGMAQRVALARALLARADAYLFDEPLSSVDVPQKEAIQVWLRDFVLGEGSGVLHVTHDPYEAVFLADRIYVLGGRPATIQSVLEIEAPRRDAEFRRSAAFAHFVDRLRNVLLVP
jgi:ABC-type nitrate/sulfonate/bicarbonate transport system ATPase subunit